MSNLRQEKREEKSKFFVDVFWEVRVFFCDFTKRNPYNNPTTRPAIIDTRIVYKVIFKFFGVFSMMRPLVLAGGHIFLVAIFFSYLYNASTL